MWIELLRAHNLRCFEAVEVRSGPRFNWFVGPNGAGKTTLLEAIYLLSHGHSFRSGPLDALIRREAGGFDLYAELARNTASHRVGLARSADEWRVHVDGRAGSALSPLLETCATVCFEPGSIALISGPAEWRRRYLDWGVFHVEHLSLDLWRDYRRALRQRNALLKSSQPGEGFEFWEAELGRLGEQIDAGRQAYFGALQAHLTALMTVLLPELGMPSLAYRSGWDRQRSLRELLGEHRARDSLRGHTRLGPHHADWRLDFQHALGREFLSRGQTKMAALGCVLAQAALYAEHYGEWPVLCLDDLNSELDPAHQRSALDWIAGHPVQAWLTATLPPTHFPGPTSQFHVERAGVIAA